MHVLTAVRELKVQLAGMRRAEAGLAAPRSADTVKEYVDQFSAHAKRMEQVKVQLTASAGC